MTYTDIYNDVLAELNRSDKASMVSSWVNERYQYVLSAYDFEWLYNTQVIPSVLNTWEYSVATDFGKPKSLILDNGSSSKPLRVIDLDIFDQRYSSPGDDGAGTPDEAAFRQSFDGSYVRTVKLLCYPKANSASLNFNLRYFVDAPVLSAAMVPIIPVKHQYILVFGGLHRGFAHLREYEAARYWEGQFDKRLAEMIDEDKRKPALSRGLGTFNPGARAVNGDYWKDPLIGID